MNHNIKDLDFIIIGALKSASTWVHETIRLHPEIEIPKDEISFFFNGKNLEKITKQEESSMLGIRHSEYLWQFGVPQKIKLLETSSVLKFLCMQYSFVKNNL